MTMEQLQEFWLPYLICNMIAGTVLWLAWKKPTAARITLGVIFVAASLVNSYVAIINPADYLEYGEFAVLEVYREFISGWFATHVRPMVLCIAAGQLLIGIGMFTKGLLKRSAIVGIVTFGFAIAPLGIASAFPCSVLLAIAAMVLWRNPVASE